MYRVLYVDDDPHLLDVARFFLEGSGEIKLETAKLATEALKLPGLSSFDAIVADYEMPRMDGIAFLKKVRADHGDIPFILFTGKGREQIVIEAINNGTDFYLQKGGEPKSQFAELAHKVKNAIERRRAKAALQESERRYRNLYHHALVGLFETSLSDATVVACNKKYCDMFGFDSVDDAIGKDVLSLYAKPEDRYEVSRLLHEKGAIDDYEIQFINRKTGLAFFAQISARINRGKDVAEGTIIDITGRKQAEDDLAFKNLILSTQQETSPNAILIVDEKARILNYNAKFAEIWNIPKHILESLDDKPVLEYVCSQIQDPESFLERVLFLYDHPEEKSFEELHSKDGRVIERFSSPILGDDDTYFGRVWYFRDITERKLAEESLAESETTLRSLIDESSDGIMLIDESGRIIEWNPALTRILGIARDETVGKPYAEILQQILVSGNNDPKRIDRHSDEMNTMLTTGICPPATRRLEVDVCRTDGSRCRIQQTFFPIRTTRGFRIGSITRDITNQK